MEGISKDYKYLEFAKNSVRKTKTGPSIQWCINKDLCIAEFYEYRADCPQVIEVIKELKKASKAHQDR